MSTLWIVAPLLFLVGSLLLALTIGPIINRGNHRAPPMVKDER